MGIQEFIENLGGLIAYTIRLLVSIALLVFLWGAAQAIFRFGGSEAKVEEGKNVMKWGLIALFVMLSVWGIITFFQENLGLTDFTV